MSINNQPLNNGSQAITNYDLAKIFIWNNRYETGLYTNSVYTTETLLAGTIMGRVGSTNQLVKCFASANDGSQFPIGVLADNYVIPEGVVTSITMCIKGDVVADKLIFEEGDALNTVVNGSGNRTILDLLQTYVKVVNNTEMTDYDNQ